MKKYLICMLLFLIPVIAGCSGNSSPLSPVNTGIENLDTNRLPVGVTDTFPNGQPAAGYGVLGLYSIEIDSSNDTATITSLRQNSLTDVLEIVDITSFLEISPCTDCVKLGSVSFDPDGNIILAIGIKHPFEAGNPLEPITGMNRGDLHVFNVEGIVISNNSTNSFSKLGQSVADFVMSNADGYSGYLDDVLDSIYPTGATIHPYKTHFDDYTSGNFSASNPMGFASVTEPPPSGNLVMAMGCDYDFQSYEFELDFGENISFMYAIGCTYAVSSAAKNQRFNPEYRIPQHNKKAASEVWVEIISNDLEAEDLTSAAELEISVVDINHGVSVGPGLDQMLSDSSVDEIIIEVPQVMTNNVTVDGSSAISGTGHDPSDPLVYSATVTNTANGQEGTYNGLVCVKDSYAPGQNTADLLNHKDGIKRVGPYDNPLSGLFDISEFATYQVFTLDVAEQQTTIYVDNAHTGPVFDGTKTNPFATIQEGIDAAPLGWDVKVDDSGTPYAESIYMKSDAIVVSNNWDTSDGSDRAVIDPPDNPDTNTVLFDNVSNASISGFEFGYPGPTVIYVQTVRLYQGSDNTISNCLFTGVTDQYFVTCIENELSKNLTIEYCEFSGIDTTTNSLYAVKCVNALDADGLVIRNNRVKNICETINENGISFYGFDVDDTDTVTVKNNLISHLIFLSNLAGSQFFEGFTFNTCTGIEIANNTIDDINVTNAFFIQQAFAYRFDSCAGTDFYNNIGSKVHADNSFPPGLARGVMNISGTLICDYTCIYDIFTPYYVSGSNIAQEGVGCLQVDPMYIDSINDNYDLDPSSPAQAGDPSFLDWDDDDSGGYESQSRMGCHGGPDGEIVGLLN